MGCVVPTPEFLQALRELTAKHGALLICDEVMTGFRVAYGGAQALLKIQPDITTLGKIVGGGHADRSVRRPARDHAAHPARGQSVSSRHAQRQSRRHAPRASPRCRSCATIRRTSSWSRSRPGWSSGLHAAAEQAGMPHSITRVGSMLTLFFNRAAAGRLGHAPARATRPATPILLGPASTAASICRAASTKRCSSPRRTARPISTRRSRPRARCVSPCSRIRQIGPRHAPGRILVIQLRGSCTAESSSASR